MRSLAYLLTAVLIVASSAASISAADGAAVAYRVDGRPYEGYYIAPAPGAPLVLLIHDWDGLTDYEIRRAAMLSDAGYAVFAIDLFGAGVRPTTIEDKRRQTVALYKDRGKMRSLMYGALAAAQNQGADTGNAVAMGYCFGGAAVLELARSGADLKGFVSFHGGLKTPEGQDYAQTRGEVLVFHGSADDSVSMQDFAALADQLEAAGVAHEMTTYSGAPHAFTVYGTERYRKDADEKSWNRFLAFLSARLR
jgi:dienelactone hydrolase